ncbi:MULTISPECIES: hypothetical protein [unclassified Streptomyces]|uniref:hypothetical protein n=1 Tax=unclassified Streptomyces TaxID=2593676 RepID=UPI00236531E3|nr:MULTISPECIES: hypothetical protein [unclassified Streptomyces]MDF3146363.1 hypothetical protein [Streptomyces sp. T21Q-yed]WDF39211.1 hypothetical protein PBV52_21605 [Streptomyces sp. T12]
MIGRQRIATVSGLIGALAVLYSGAAPAYADDPKGDCTISEQGDIVCIKKSEIVRKDKRGKYVVKQKQDCQTIERPRFAYSDGSLLNGGDVKSGPVVECSNKADLPKSYKLPKFKFKF